jgi:uncharacterized repeat protein (TIGR01451 family)
LDDPDLDDDNDGILDTDEAYLKPVQGEFGGTFGTLSTGTRDLQNPVVGYTYVGGVNAMNGSGRYAVFAGNFSDQAHSSTVPGVLWNGRRGHTTGALDDAFLGVNGNTVSAVFFQETFALKAARTYRISAWFVAESADVSLQVRIVRVSDNTVIASRNIANPLVWTEAAVSFVPPTTEDYRLEIRNLSVTASSNDFSIDDISITVPTVDLDLDGIPDYQDTDSDADGCPDAIEGGAGFTAGDLSGGRLTGGVNASGVPTILGSPQTSGDSQVATRVVVNTAPVNQKITTFPSAASFSITTTATNTTSFTAGTPNYGSGTSANASTAYRWYLGNPDAGGTALTNTGVYSGTTSATLGISDVTGLIGNTYYVVVTQTNHTCTRIVRSGQLLPGEADLRITKTNNLPGTTDQASDTVTRGQSTSYRIVVTNSGPDSVTGAVVTDTASGLTCTGLTCASSSGSSCPAAPTAAQLTGAGVTLLALPVGGTVTMDLACTVN